MRLLVPLLAAIPLAAQSAADLAAEIRNISLDSAECFRVRELHFQREDLRFFFGNGYLIFGKPVGGRRIVALFAADVESGDGELVVMPPTRDERQSLARFTRTPNLSEHFYTALLLFSDDTGEQLQTSMRERGFAKSPEAGLLLAEHWNPVARNLSGSFVIRFIEELIDPPRPGEGFFYAALRGKELGNFDAMYDPTSREQIFVGQLAYRENRVYFDTWTSFPARSYRTGQRKSVPPLVELDNFRVQAELDGNLQMTARAKVTVTPSRSGLRALSFDLSPRLKVGEARINGEPAEVFRRESLRANLLRGGDNEMLLVVARAPLESGRACEIEFDYSGDPVLRAGEKVYFVGARGSWYPRRGLAFARYDVTFKYPSSLQLLFPGELKDDRTEGDRRIVRKTIPEPIRLVGFNLGDYTHLQTARGGYAVEVYANRTLETALQPRVRDLPAAVPPPVMMPGRRQQSRPSDLLISVAPPPVNPAARLETLADEVATAFEFMSRHFGPPPLKTLMVSPIPGAFGQGFPGLVYLSTISYLDPASRPAVVRGQVNQLFFSEMLHAHETAHQWWGNTVTSAAYQDDWLMEALANYSAMLMLERRKGGRALESVLTSYREHLLSKDEEGETRESAGPVRLGLRLRSSLSPDAWRVVLYEKGSWIIHMLRRRLGDERFLKMLGEMVRRYRLRAVGTEEFRVLAAEFLPPGSPDPKLQSFFDSWVYGTGVPTVKMTHTVKGKAPALRLTVTVSQSGVAGDFEAHVPVRVEAPGMKPEVRWVRTGADPETITLNLRRGPARVALDPDDSVLMVK